MPPKHRNTKNSTGKNKSSPDPVRPITESDPDMDLTKALEPVMQKLELIGKDISDIKTDVGKVKSDVEDLKKSVTHANK